MFAVLPAIMSDVTWRIDRQGIIYVAIYVVYTDLSPKEILTGVACSQADLVLQRPITAI